MPTLTEALAYARQRGLPSHEARMLLEHASGYDRVALIAHGERQLHEAAHDDFNQLVDRRLAGEPIAYLLGQREFYGRPFKVSPAVLIPRPETELLVELALQLLSAESAPVLDLGTGSGILPITLACERPEWQLIAVDVSREALAVARENGEALGAKVRWLHGDWYQPLTEERFALIVSNPPYIRAGDPHLAQGDLRFEPASALTDHADGLAHLRTIIAGAPSHLLAGGWLLLEHGYDQAADCRQLLTQAGFDQVQSWSDLAAIERVSGARWPA